MINVSYLQRPEVKARRREYNRLYMQRPEVQARRPQYGNGQKPLPQLDGVIFHPGRRQPFTVWVRGRVIKFCSSRWEAEAMFEKMGGGLDRTRVSGAARPQAASLPLPSLERDAGTRLQGGAGRVSDGGAAAAATSGGEGGDA